MFYHYLRFLNFFFCIFGLKKPFQNNRITLVNKLWFVVVLSCMITGYYISTKDDIAKMMNQLNVFYKTNSLVVNTIILLLDLFTKKSICVQLYEVVAKIFTELKIPDVNSKMIAIKLYLGVITCTLLLIVFIIAEIMWSDPFTLLINIPIYLSTSHLVLHLYLIAAILGLIEFKLSEMLALNEKPTINSYIQEKSTKFKRLLYILSPGTRFMEADRKNYFELKFLCTVYDSLGTCIQLLEQHHGVQMLLTFWLLFSNTVLGVTMVACKQVSYTSLVAARSIMPFSWCYVGCFVNYHMSKAVDQIEKLIIKYLIDFRCDPPRKVILQTFRQLVSANRLQFTSCSLFHLNCSMILGTIVNVITYSIIMIQLFLNDVK